MGIFNIFTFLIFYFQPTILAIALKKLNTNDIFMLNVIPIVGFFIALIMVFQCKDHKEEKFEFKHYRAPVIFVSLLIYSFIFSSIKDNIDAKFKNSIPYSSPTIESVSTSSSINIFTEKIIPNNHNK